METMGWIFFTAELIWQNKKRVETADQKVRKIQLKRFIVKLNSAGMWLQQCPNLSPSEVFPFIDLP